MDPAEIKALIENGLKSAQGDVRRAGNSRYHAEVISGEFAGKRAIARHQLVYKCLGALMGNEIHAMSIRAHTPEEWQDLNPSAGA